MKINGSDLMVFVKIGTKYKSIALAKNHTLDVTMNTKDTSTKDNGNGIWSNFEAGLISWTMGTENLVSDTGATGLCFDDLMGFVLTHEPVELVFSMQTNIPDYSEKINEEFEVPSGGWTPDDKNYYHGKALITALNLTAQNGEIATMNATFTGCGNLMRAGSGIGTFTPITSRGASTPVIPTPAVETAAIKK